MIDLLSQFFALFCGQNLAHTWTPGTIPLPCCERCTGIYVGACLALALHLSCRPKATGRFLTIHGFFLLLIAPFGLHWLPDEGSVLRTMTGVACGFGLATFLWQVPAARWMEPRLRVKTPVLFGYYLGLAATLVLVPTAASAGGPVSAWILSAMIATGLLALLALALVNGIMGLKRTLFTLG